MSVQRMRASLRCGLLLSVVSLAGCFNWDFLKGQPCANSKECEPLTCNNGVCDDGDDGNDGGDGKPAVCTPRVLFFLDTSGSMAMDLTHMHDADVPNTRCGWDECEDDEAGPLQSRINAARKVIHDVAHAHADEVEFALMTYASAAPPTQGGTALVPQPCTALSTNGSLLEGESYRFTWVKNVNQAQEAWSSATNVFGTEGMWVLCGDNRPFPYLRHDDLGGFSMPDDRQEPLPDVPLVLAEADVAAYQDPENYSRKVQWFPRFMGRRVNLDCADPLQAAIVGNTAGDYDSDPGKLANVCGRDFYYWPYVDGNPGYSVHEGLSTDLVEHTECDANGAGCQSETDQIHRLGIARREAGGGATLYAPFYSDAALSDADIPDVAKGPMSRADAWLMFDGVTSKSYTGGADVMGGAPLASSVGNPDVTTENTTAWANSAFSQSTISSYIYFLREIETDPICQTPTVILIMDGLPDPWVNEGGSKLYERLRALRGKWDVKTYVVGFTEESYADPVAAARFHEIACAASGADSLDAPCTGGKVFGWDTCAASNDPSSGCAWLSADPEQLQSNVEAILAKVVAAAQ
jgi:hypothetical protein